MAEHPNAIHIRRVYNAYAARDLTAVAEQFAPDLTFHVGGDGPLAGVQKGREGLAAVIAHSLETTGGTQQFELHNVYADDEHAVVHVRETATRAADGVTLDVEEVHLLALGDGGLIEEFWDIPSDPDVHDAFFDGR